MLTHRSPFCLASAWIAIVSLAWNAQENSLRAQEPVVASPDSVLQSLLEREPESALKLLGEIADQGLTIGDLIYSNLPSAAGGLHRAMSQMSPDEQYELLEGWTLPSGDRDEVRLIAVPVPTDAPPKVFARALGERPRDTTFSVASVGDVNGVFCSGWMLAKAADEVGRLARLRSNLETLVEEGVPGSEPMLMLSYLAGPRGDTEKVLQYLNGIASLNDETEELNATDLVSVAVAAAALSNPELQSSAETVLAHLVERGGSGQGIGLRPLLRIAHATAVQIHRGESSAEEALQRRLKYWIPVTVRTAKDIRRGQPRSLWLTHEEHVLHLAGGTTDLLLFRYPLRGDFDFICETQEGGEVGTDGGLTYGGLQFQALGRKDKLQIWDADGDHLVVRPSPFARFGTKPTFNRVSIRSRDDQPCFESNFHPVWRDDERTEASPWLGLRSSGTKRPVFRNLELQGKPRIPSEVALCTGNSLRGWQSGFFEETQPGFDETPAPEATFNWQLRDGVLVGSASQDESVSAQPGALYYQRPLLENESITYEFLEQGTDSQIFPAVGRLAFLLEEGGVRVRWITAGEFDWTGLKQDNAALEPLNRRGPRPIPLKKEDWNSVRVERSRGFVLVHLNDELIYQRKFEQPVATFGFYRPHRHAETQIRNVVFAGDWPTTVPEEFLLNPTALVVSVEE